MQQVSQQTQQVMYVSQQLQPQPVMQQVPQLTQTVMQVPQQPLLFMQQTPRQPQPTLSYMMSVSNQKFMYL